MKITEFAKIDKIIKFYSWDNKNPIFSLIKNYQKLVLNNQNENLFSEKESEEWWTQQWILDDFDRLELDDDTILRTGDVLYNNAKQSNLPYEEVKIFIQSQKNDETFPPTKFGWWIWTPNKLLDYPFELRNDDFLSRAIKQKENNGEAFILRPKNNTNIFEGNRENENLFTDSIFDYPTIHLLLDRLKKNKQYRGDFYERTKNATTTANVISLLPTTQNSSEFLGSWIPNLGFIIACDHRTTDNGDEMSAPRIFYAELSEERGTVEPGTITWKADAWLDDYDTLNAIFDRLKHLEDSGLYRGYFEFNKDIPLETPNDNFVNGEAWNNDFVSISIYSLEVANNDGYIVGTVATYADLPTPVDGEAYYVKSDDQAYLPVSGSYPVQGSGFEAHPARFRCINNNGQGRDPGAITWTFERYTDDQIPHATYKIWGLTRYATLDEMTNKDGNVAVTPEMLSEYIGSISNNNWTLEDFFNFVYNLSTKLPIDIDDFPDTFNLAIGDQNGIRGVDNPDINNPTAIMPANGTSITTLHGWFTKPTVNNGDDIYG